LNFHVVSDSAAIAGTLLHTTDGGTTWTTIWLPTNFDAPGLASTSHRVVVGTSGGGSGWKDGQFTMHYDGDLQRFEQLDESLVLHATRAHRCTFALTALNDHRWIAVGSGIPIPFFLHPSRSPLRLQTECRILVSGDGGDTWEPAKGSEGKGCLRGVASHDPKVVVAVGDSGQILRSEDGGKNWKPVARNNREDFQAAACGTDGTLVAVGRKGAAAVSRDDGKTWKPLTLGIAADLRAISAAGKFFYVVGTGGTAIRLLPD
jgi:photosystem II stability/assembly factor-like uncharacterized protein